VGPRSVPQISILGHLFSCAVPLMTFGAPNLNCAVKCENVPLMTDPTGYPF
jgi:hypothetical protein